jgi:hypothetical protein
MLAPLSLQRIGCQICFVLVIVIASFSKKIFFIPADATDIKRENGWGCGAEQHESRIDGTRLTRQISHFALNVNGLI